ncbi:MAG: protease modulator HflC [Betaproteobacteria bacterium]|nr:protease modulator HflC [Betaproteobacteria bacterium]
MKRSFGPVAAVVIVVLIVLSLGIFSVDQRQNAIVFRLGETIKVIKEPGIAFKIPLLDNVRFFDTRILTLDADDPERFITSEKKNVLVDSFVKWRIVDVLEYYKSVDGDEARARIRLSQTVNSSLREEFGKRTIHDVVSGERDKIMELMREKADADARKIGVQVLDVRLKRVDLPQEVSDAVYRRMEAERKRVANELRSQGYAESERIRADADKQREVIVAEAYRDAQRIKGEGDGKAAAIYANAFQDQPEFYAFYRSLEAYKQSFKSKNDVMVLEPNSEFFRFMKGAGGRSGR